VAPISINRIRFSTRSLPKAAHRVAARLSAYIALSRGFKTARGANGQFRSRQQQNEQVIETASPTCMWTTEEFNKQREIARKQGKLG
jgi:hypothetical protein